MRTWFGMAVVAGLFGCAQAPDRVSTPALSTRMAPGGITIRQVQQGILHCKVPGGTGAYSSCMRIPVIVLELGKSPDDGCIALIPYHELKIHGRKNNNNANVKVEWEIVGPDYYKFDATAGINFDPNTQFTNGTLHPKGRLFSWDVAPYALAPASGVNHVALVRRPFLSNGQAPANPYCDQADPVAINTDQ